jgi:hypothetical protein
MCPYEHRYRHNHYEKFGDTKGITRSINLREDRQCIDQKKLQKDKNKSRQKQQHKKEEIEQYESH